MALKRPRSKRNRRLLIALAAMLVAGFLAGVRTDNARGKRIKGRLTEIRLMPGRLFT